MRRGAAKAKLDKEVNRIARIGIYARIVARSPCVADAKYDAWDIAVAASLHGADWVETFTRHVYARREDTFVPELAVYEDLSSQGDVAIIYEYMQAQMIEFEGSSTGSSGAVGAVGSNDGVSAMESADLPEVVMPSAVGCSSTLRVVVVDTMQVVQRGVEHTDSVPRPVVFDGV